MLLHDLAATDKLHTDECAYFAWHMGGDHEDKPPVCNCIHSRLIRFLAVETNRREEDIRREGVPVEEKKWRGRIFTTFAHLTRKLVEGFGRSTGSTSW